MPRSWHMRVCACVLVFALGLCFKLNGFIWGVLLGGAFQSPTPCEAYAPSRVVTRPRALRFSGEVSQLSKAVRLEPTFGLSAIARCIALWTEVKFHLKVVNKVLAPGRARGRNGGCLALSSSRHSLGQPRADARGGADPHGWHGPAQEHLCEAPGKGPSAWLRAVLRQVAPDRPRA